MKRPKQKIRPFRSIKLWLKTFGISAAALAICGSVTFAALQSQQVVLANNTIRSASANLQIGKDGDSYGGQTAGFSFENIEPGGSPIPANGNIFYLKNFGTTTLGLRIALDTTALVNPDHVDLNKISAIITPVSGGSPQTYTLATLTGYGNTGGGAMNLTLPSGGSAAYRIQIAMTADALNGNNTMGTYITGFNLIFSGLSVAS